MSDFKIEEVLSQESFSTEHGQFVSYEVRFSGEQGSGVAQHKRKASSPAPAVGEVIDAELVQKNGKTELKRVWKQNGGGGGSSTGRSPQDTKQIVRQHSQHMAILWAAVLQKEGLQPNPDSFKPWLKNLIDWFHQDAEGAS